MMTFAKFAHVDAFRCAAVGCAMIAFGFPAVDAQQQTLCPRTDDQSNCVRILACIGDKCRWFHRRALGPDVTTDGIGIKAWSGLNVLDYLEQEADKVNVLPCGTLGNPADVPIG